MKYSIVTELHKTHSVNLVSACGVSSASYKCAPAVSTIRGYKEMPGGDTSQPHQTDNCDNLLICRKKVIANVILLHQPMQCDAGGRGVDF